ncbi:hypothetical protein LG198_14270 [Methylobacillus arboreus]|uniref:hypothetical protein n=1 Tax=Methylobacillus arboreus TaxID=755170 RepID=UPI001E282A72|nr:hypothetical protein [Methylobacillus arboreus]MCB5191895.1 hypothetical protein [Methylobacillus arboreus]
MDPLSPLDGIAELIRRKVAAESLNKGQFQALGKAGQSQAKTTQSDKPNADAIKHKVVTQIKGISGDDPKRSHKAVTLFVENILAWQFGDELRNDPGFSELVENVVEVLEKEPAIVQQLIALTKP